MKHNSEIQIRDPFVLLANGRYYMYGTTDEQPWRGQATGFNYYDLEYWKGSIYKQDGGHGMVFGDKEKQLMLTIHTPNKTPKEHPIFIEMEAKDTTLAVKQEA